MHTATALSEPAAPPPKEPITETIAAHLEGGAPAAVLTDLKDRAQAELDRRRDEERSLREGSIDPRLSVLDARAKRDAADDAAHEVRRIEAAVSQIDAVLPGLRAAEHQEAIRPAYEAFRAERSAFIERLRKRWPIVGGEMVQMLQEIERYRQGPQIEIPDGADPLREDVEAVARGCPGNFYVPFAGGGGGAAVVKLSSAVIPAFDVAVSAPDYLWARGPKRG